MNATTLDVKDVKTEKRAALMLGALCSIVYFTSYFTRYGFTVCISEITGTTSLTAANAGFATMLLFVFYGIGQIVSGLLGDKIRPELLILLGLCGAASANLLLPLAVGYPPLLAVLWAFHGFLQSFFWPPLVKITATRLPASRYNGVVLAISISAHVASIGLYLLAPLFIASVGWRYLFPTCAGFAFAAALVWILGYRKYRKKYRYDITTAPIPSKPEENGKHKHSTPLGTAFIGSGALILVVGIVMQGSLKEGIAAWLPSFIVNTYGGTASDAILRSVLIPLSSIACLILVSFLYRRVLKNEAFGALCLFAIGAAMSAVISFVPELPAMLSIILAAMTTGCMHGVNLFLIAYLPARFAKYGKASTVSGVTNGCTYVGSSAYTYGIALLATRFGWWVTSLSWVIIASVGMLVCLIALRRWTRFIKQ